MTFTREQIEKLPDPYLARYLRPDAFDLKPKQYEESLRMAQLDSCHLPRDYDSLASDAQRAARFSVLESWYNPDLVHELCSDVDNFVAAHRLWVEFYLKPDKWTGGRYFFKDSGVKYDLVRACMSPPLVPTDPAKTVIHCPRGTTKTWTVIIEMCSMMVTNRPNTRILVSEINKDRTSEEVGSIRDIFETNEIIQADFGAKGDLWQTASKKGKHWSEKQLDVLHHANCSIMGYSAKAKQRGRHPIFGVIDDPEDEDTVTDRSFRKKFLDNLFKRYMGMFFRGSKIVWLGTVIRNSCLQIALKQLFNEPIDETDLEENYDKRFSSWNKVHFGMIRTDENGDRYSIMPDHTSVDAYDAKVDTMGEAVVAAELDGRPIREGKCALIRNEYKHGYMHCVNVRNYKDLPGEYMLDLNTGTVMEWRSFVDSLFKTGGCDIADSAEADADYGSDVKVGRDDRRVVFVLDCYVRRMIADNWPEYAMSQCIVWDCTRQAFDSNALQKTYARMAEHLRLEFESKGVPMPSIVRFSNGGRNKHLRVLSTLRPLYRKELVRFPHFGEVTLADGRTHYAAPHPNERYFRELYSELDTYTDEGPAGHDDAADALQMAIAAIGSGLGDAPETVSVNEKRLDQLARIGLDMRERPDLLPREAWTEEMEERDQDEERTMLEGIDPYAYI